MSGAVSSMRKIAFIPVRAGSKSIVLKNIREINSRPLVHWSLLAASTAGIFEKIVVSTDSPEIERVVLELEIPGIEIFRRGKGCATDVATTESAVLEYLNQSQLSDDVSLCLIQATSPLTKSEDFLQAYRQMEMEHSDSLLTGVEFKRFFWKSSCDGSSSPLNYNLACRPRRQEFKGSLMENGAFYIGSVGGIKQSKCRLYGKISFYKMPEYMQFEIDEHHDWIVMESLLRNFSTAATDLDQIKFFLTDLDGTLTDGGMYYSQSGDEMKRFTTIDGKAFELLRNRGIKTGIITGEHTDIAKRRAEKLQIDFLRQGEVNKLKTVSSLCDQLGLTLANVAYIGDDVNDLELLNVVGKAACPKNSIIAQKYLSPRIEVLNQEGGHGAVREFVEKILTT